MIAFISFLFLLAGILAVAFGHLQVGHVRTRARGHELMVVGFVVSGLALVGMLLGMLRYDVVTPNQSRAAITDFAECAAAGYPIQESYPEVCKGPNGQSFVNHMPKLQACPQAWYRNTMPTGTDVVSQEYFIYDDRRVELDEVDVEWVTVNCSVNAPQEVQ